MIGDGSPLTFDDEDRQALADFAWIMSGWERGEVEETAVHVWRIRHKASTERIIDRWLPAQFRAEYEQQRHLYEDET